MLLFQMLLLLCYVILHRPLPNSASKGLAAAALLLLPAI
jgi:hypothetical protein